MPRYFFHLRDQGGLHLDPEGADLPDDEAAQAEALLNARELLRVSGVSVRSWLGRSYEINTEDGQLVRAVPFTEAIDTTA